MKTGMRPKSAPPKRRSCCGKKAKPEKPKEPEVVLVEGAEETKEDSDDPLLKKIKTGFKLIFFKSFLHTP